MTLKDAGVSLIDCDHRTPAALDEGYPYIAIPQLKNGHITLDGVRRISREDYLEWTKKLKPQANDVIVVRRCNSGQSAYVPAGLDCAIGQNLVVLRANGEYVLPEFLRWLVQGPDWWGQVSKFINVGAVFDSLRCRDIPSFELNIPPREEQTKIAGLLGSLDDRITLLRETNATLEAIAQALFKSWFVDFDPVRAKAEGRARQDGERSGQPRMPQASELPRPGAEAGAEAQGQPEGLDAATAALFPDSFEESELGLVPKGWLLWALGDAFEINPTRKLKKGDFAPYLDMASVGTQGHVVDGVVGREMGSGTKFINGDTLLARITPCLENGKTAYVDFLDAGQVGWGSTEFVVLRPKAPLPPYYGYLLARHPAFRDHAIQSMSGTSGRQRIQNDVLGRYPVAIPTPEVAEAFAGIVQSAQQRIAANQTQAQTLTQLRDTLLPRLISGQLRLPEAETQLENAL
ncbi:MULTISPECIES: restriction endonuclease subunit S [Pseudomonadaceae]|jgi:type I restriction enzyme S subunit|uniref:restriction endonuclease subunit S n=1 Tax=Pseudomonadaceae TaxID=135621 RepID=UPI001C8C17AF|nr:MULTISPECIES: restriction endonuclease subunit S [Pseudomonadaceae]MDY1568734.1 restriction endonuclease subunit S [Pseudomonas aeruginosa]